MPGVDWSAVTLTLKLATLTTLILLVVSTPLAWHLAHTRGWWRGAINAVVNLPFVLPPTVLGFYLLVLMGPKGPVGSLCDAIGVPRLPFTFYGLLVASVIYSLPFDRLKRQRHCGHHLWIPSFPSSYRWQSPVTSQPL